MNRKRSLTLLLSLAVLALPAGRALAQSPGQAAFEKIKSLAGDWRGTESNGDPFKTSYQVASGGSAVIETLSPAKEATMVTVYHLDGGSLMMTHYCSSGNQPRMRATVAPGEVKSLDFKFVDATNLAKPTDGHMKAMSLAFLDKDHITQAWTWTKDGKDDSNTFKLERAK
jgi:hypothetical protein